MPSVLQPAMGLGDMLMQQVSAETDEQRRKRLQANQQQQSGLSPLSSSMGNTRSGALSSVYGGAY